MSRKSLWAATKLGLLTNDMLHRKKLRHVKLGAEKHGLAIIASFVLLSGKDGERSLDRTEFYCWPWIPRETRRQKEKRRWVERQQVCNLLGK